MRRLVKISIRVNPQSGTSNIHIEWRKNRLPRQTPLAPLKGVMWNSKAVVKAVAIKTVKTSRNIQSLAVPRALRTRAPVAAESHSVDIAREVDSLCQKSELAIYKHRPQELQLRLDNVS